LYVLNGRIVDVGEIASTHCTFFAVTDCSVVSTEMLGCKPGLCQIKSFDHFLAQVRDAPSSDGVDGVDDAWR